MLSHRLRIFLALALLSTGTPEAFAGKNQRQAHGNPIPPRLQWDANKGYCGETSLISAGLYYGQYASQYDVRIAAIGTGVRQNRGEMLLGVNDRRAAQMLRLSSSEWPSARQSTTREFLTWIKQNVRLGRPVIIGVYMNKFRFTGARNPNSGDPQYDHIVPVLSVSSERPLRIRKYFPGDRLTFSDNGLWGSLDDRPYLFSSSFARFPGTRQEANQPDAPVYTLPDDGPNYGITITGVMDPNGDTLPVRIQTSKNDERPVMVNGSNTRPSPRPLDLKVTVSGLRPHTDYRIYRYDAFEKIPVAGFNARARNASRIRHIRIESGSSYTFVESILSDEVAAYRAVRTDAP